MSGDNAYNSTEVVWCGSHCSETGLVFAQHLAPGIQELPGPATAAATTTKVKSSQYELLGESMCL